MVLQSALWLSPAGVVPSPTGTPARAAVSDAGSDVQPVATSTSISPPRARVKTPETWMTSPIVSDAGIDTASRLLGELKTRALTVTGATFQASHESSLAVS